MLFKFSQTRFATVRTVGCCAVAATMLSACSNLGGRTDPVIASSIGSDLNALATGAERRLVLSARGDAYIPSVVTKSNGETETTYQIQPDGALLTCAEPSPDAVEALAASITAKIEASSTTDRRAKAELAQEVSTSVGAVLKRSQGLQFFRDGIFALCQGSMNGLRNSEAIERQFDALRSDAVKLIMAEINTPGWGSAPTIKLEAPKSESATTN